MSVPSKAQAVSPVAAVASFDAILLVALSGVSLVVASPRKARRNYVCMPHIQPSYTTMLRGDYNTYVLTCSTGVNTHIMDHGWFRDELSILLS